MKYAVLALTIFEKTKKCEQIPIGVGRRRQKRIGFGQFTQKWLELNLAVKTRYFTYSISYLNPNNEGTSDQIDKDISK